MLRNASFRSYFTKCYKFSRNLDKMSPKLRACLLTLILNTHLVSPFLFGNRDMSDLLRLNRTSEKIKRKPAKIPTFMVMLYRMIAKPGGLLKGKIPYNVNAVRGIYPERVTKTSSASMELYCQIHYLRNFFTPRRDEIHLYKKQQSLTDENIFKPFVIAVEDIHTAKLIRKFTVPAFNQGWQVLSLRGWSKRWIKDPSSNEGIRITVHRGRRGKLADDNPFINFAQDKEPYFVLFGNDASDSISDWRFLRGYPMNSVSGTARHRRESKILDPQPTVATSRVGSLRHGSQAPTKRAQTRCEAVQKSVELNGRKINKEHIIVEPRHYTMTHCTKTCVALPYKRFPGISKEDSGQTRFQKVCCVPTELRAVAFLVTEPSRLTVTVAIVPNMSAAGCKWAAAK